MLAGSALNSEVDRLQKAWGTREAFVIVAAASHGRITVIKTLWGQALTSTKI